MGFELPIDNNYRGHPKVAHLKALTGASEADAFPIRLWCWASEYARDGKIKIPPEALEEELEWRKGGRGRRKGALFDALVEAGFIEPDRRTIHDWMDGIGRAIWLYEQKKRKLREKYARQQGYLEEESGSDGEDSDVQLVLRAMVTANIPGRLQTKTQYARAWLVRVGEPAEVVRRLLDERAKGRNLLWLEDHVFGGKDEPPPADQGGRVARLKAKEEDSK